MKKLFTILFILFLSLTLTSCSHIEDTNGPDDYSLVEISNDEIVSGKSYSTSVGKLQHKQVEQ